MKLSEFIDHMKHNSVKIVITDYLPNEELYKGDVGCYKTSVIKSSIDKCDIVYIKPDNFDEKLLRLFIVKEK